MASFSSSNAVVSRNSPIQFSSACNTEAVDIARIAVMHKLKFFIMFYYVMFNKSEVS